MSLSYLRVNAPSLPPLLFLHGFLGCKEDWLPLFSHLGNTHCCYAVDLPGHGDSPAQEDLLHALETLPLQGIPTLVGYSLGGRLALQLAQKHPKRYRSLILLSSHFGLTDPEEKEKRYQRDCAWADKLATLPFPTFLQEWYAQPLFASLKKRPQYLQELMRRRVGQDPLPLARILKAHSLGRQTYTLPSLPALALFGEEDWTYAALYRTLPSTVSVAGIPEAGHILPLENPEVCAHKINTFLRG